MRSDHEGEPATAGPAIPAAPKPPNESLRIAALHAYGILDSGAEQLFDDLTELAAQICGTPMALISLVDSDRQWFKARRGVALCETSRGTSFCAHAINDGEIMVVPDASEDSRFVNNPLVTGEPFIRYYAGAPLVTHDGHALGTLCVLDDAPRELSPIQIAQLEVLARQVVSQLELRRQSQALATEINARAVAESALRDNRRLLDGILAHTDIAIYAKDLDGRYLLTNAALDRLLGTEAGGANGKIDSELFTADVAAALSANDAATFATGERTVHPEDLPHADGTTHGYLTTRFPLRDPDGEIYAVAGVASDITELNGERAARAASEKRWRDLVERSPGATAVIDSEAKFAYANPQALTLYGVETEAELIGRDVLDFVPAGTEAATREKFIAQLSEDSSSRGNRWTLRRPDGEELIVEIDAAIISHRGSPAVQVELRNVTSQAKAEVALQQSEQRFRVLFECLTVGALESLPDGTIVTVNPQLCALLGYREDELVGSLSRDLLADAEEVGRHEQALAEIAGGVSSYFTNRVFRRKDGTLVTMLVGVGVAEAIDGVPQRVLATLTDISDLVAAQAELSKARDELVTRQVFTDAILDSIDVGVVACDADGQVTVINRAVQSWAGLNDTVIAVTGTGALADPAAAATLSRAQYRHLDGSMVSHTELPLNRVLAEGNLASDDLVFAPADRPRVETEWTGRRLVGPQGRPLGAVVALRDLTSARAQTRALRASEARFQTAFTHDPSGLAVVTLSGRATQVNPAYCRIVGRTASQLLELSDLRSIAIREDQAKLTDLAREALTAVGATATGECRMLHADGNELWTQVTFIRLGDHDNDSADSLLVQVEDITAQRASQEQLTRQALYDNLTDLPNRAMLLDRAEQALARLARRNDDALVALLFCDLDGFKDINDTWGHAAGDSVLTAVAYRLREAMRPTDTVARLGGDEFLVLCENLPDSQTTHRIETRLREAIRRPISWLGGEQLSVDVSIGVAFATRSMTASELLHAADAAMYEAKRSCKMSEVPVPRAG